jgi:hypothetical protein
MTTDNFCFYLQNRLFQTNQTGGQWYSDTSPFSIPCPVTLVAFEVTLLTKSDLKSKTKYAQKIIIIIIINLVTPGSVANRELLFIKLASKARLLTI